MTGDRQSAETALSALADAMYGTLDGPTHRAEAETTLRLLRRQGFDVVSRAALPASTESTGAASGGVPAALDVETVADIERNLCVGLDAWYADHASDTGTRFMGADGPFYKVVQATVNRLAVLARSASEPAGSAPTPGLREAAQNVVDKAEPDDNFDGEYVDFLVPFEAIEALKAALAAPGAAGQPAGTTNP